MTVNQPAQPPAPRAPRRRWVTVTAILIGCAMLVAPGVVGIIGFGIANSDSGTRPAAPIAGFVYLAAGFLIAAAVGIALLSLLFLIARPARSRLLLGLHVVGTALAIGLGVVAVVVTGPWFDQF